MNATNLTLPAPTAVPNLATSAMLVDVSVGSWTASKKDRRASADVALSNHADAKLARAYKTLIASPKLDAIRSYVSKVHEVNRGMTLEWAAGLRLCPTAVLLEHKNRMAQMEAEFTRLVDDFGSDYSWLVLDMQAKLGDLHDPADYLPWEKLRQKFYFNTRYMPMPSNNFHLDVAAETEAFLREHYERVYRESIETATRGLYDRLHKALAGDGEKDGGLIGALKVEVAEDGKVTRGRVYDTRITAVRELVSLLDGLNITGDPKLASAQRALARALDGIDSKDAFKSDTTREHVRDQLLDIQNKLADW